MSTRLTLPPFDRNSNVIQLPDLLIAMGCYEGIAGVNKFGSVVEVAADTTEDVWDGGGQYTFPDGTADITHASQTTDQAAARGATLHIDGLDTSYNRVEQEVTLDGTLSTTPVALTTPLMRLNRAYVSTNVVLTSTVRVHNAAETVDYADLQIDHNQTLNAIFTVPAGFTAFLTGVHADHVPATNKDPRAVHFHVMTRRNANSEGWRVIESFGILQDGAPYVRVFSPYISLPEKTDVRLTAHPSGSPVHAHGSFDLIVVENARYPGMTNHLEDHI